MSVLRDRAAALVSKVRAQLLIQRHALVQTDDERTVAWVKIERDSDALMETVQRLEPVVDPIEAWAELSRFSAKGQQNVIVAEAAAAVVNAIEAYGAAAKVTSKVPVSPPAPGFTRAGDVQLPLGDRDAYGEDDPSQPPPAGNPPP